MCCFQEREWYTFILVLGNVIGPTLLGNNKFVLEMDYLGGHSCNSRLKEINPRYPQLQGSLLKYKKYMVYKIFHSKPLE